LNAGANLNTRTCKKMFPHLEEDNWTPLHVAMGGCASQGLTLNSTSDFTELIKLLLNGGVNVDAKLPSGSTPLLIGVRFSQGREAGEHVKVLLAAGANVNAADNDGTPLHAVAQQADILLLVVLLAARANVNAKNKAHETPLHEAASCGSEEAIRLLLGASATVNAQDKHGRTPLHFAANNRRGSLEAVRLLIKSGATVGARDKGGMTPLHAAAEKSMVNIMKELLAAGANCNAEDKNSETPLHKVICRVNFNPWWEATVMADLSVELLLKRGCSPTTRNRKG